ncbi:hypothetical protein ACFVUY_40845 [Kitasatospora sp. NPDC058063]|uniref:hypothetical protein n=1 Tax=unclassified Kitasatospora TaxID=2633591 RepID=UPI0036DEEF6D
MMDDTGQGAVALAVALRDAHFRLKRLAQAWEERAPAGAARGRESLGPLWQYSDAPDDASYTDGHVLGLAGNLTVVFELSIRFRASGTDMLAGVSVEDDAGNIAELLSTGPEEFPLSADDLGIEIGRCLDRMEQLDLSDVIR